MGLYKYERNLHPGNTAQELILEVDSQGTPVRTVTIGGEAELTYTQYLSLKDLFVLTPVKDKPQEDLASRVTPELVKSEKASGNTEATR